VTARAADRLEPRDDLQALEGYHSPQLDVAVRLNTNESPFPPPVGFVDAWLAALRDVAFHRYPDRAATDLRVALGRALDQAPERVFCANGSNEVLQTLLLTYGGPGRPALVFEPTYALHSHIARITGTPVLERDRRADFSVDPDDVEQALDETGARVVFVCSPNNPTGTVEPLSELERIASAAAARSALVVVDEAYGEFADESALELVDDARALVVVRTYSKVWSMAALRLGFAVGPAWIVSELEKVVLPYSLSAPTQLAGVLALDYRDEMSGRVQTLVSERERVSRALTEIPGVEPFPSGANFVLLHVEGDAHALWQALVERGVLVRDFSHWPRVESCLRITIGAPAENDAFLDALREALEEIR
jgi:histidinol-phosphate aminotransferase